MGWDRWWFFVVTVALVCGTPGPNMLHVMSRSVRHGFGRARWAMAGCLTAVLVALGLSAAGVGALLEASPRLFDALCIAGAAYLGWLGIKAWRGTGGPATGLDPALPGLADGAAPALVLYRDALFTGLSNPKLILFAAALFPQFLDRGTGWAGQLAILVATFLAIESSWYTVYAAGGRQLARWLADAKRQRLFDRATGVVFIGFCVAILVARA